jgi:hypothetical protein
LVFGNRNFLGCVVRLDVINRSCSQVIKQLEPHIQEGNYMLKDLYEKLAYDYDSWRLIVVAETLDSARKGVITIG